MLGVKRHLRKYKIIVLLLVLNISNILITKAWVPKESV